MIYSVSHVTDYTYDDYVSYCHNLATLKPRECQGQKLLDYQLEISPAPTDISERMDFFGNYITRFSIQNPHKQLKVFTKSKILRDVDESQQNFFSDIKKNITLENALLALKKNDTDIFDAKQFKLESLLISKVSQEANDYATISFKPNRSVFEAAFELMQRIYTDFKFVPGFTNIATPINEVMKVKKGVCQDFAQIAIACIRSIGLPARYVSGYIETLPAPGQKKLIGADASHAWFSIFIPGFGWVDFDPTNNQIPGNQHIVVAWGRDYYDVPPLKGVIYSNGKNKMKVSVDINRIN